MIQVARYPRVSRLLVLVIFCLLPVSPVVLADDGVFFDEAEKDRVRGTTPKPRRPFLIDVGSRVFEPGLATPIARGAGRTEVYIQFERPLRGKERGELRRLGVRFYGVVGATSYRAKLKDGALEALHAHPLIRGIEPVAPQDKLTGAIFNDTVAAHAVNADGTLLVRVRFYEDVKLKQALKVLDRAGIAVPDRSELLFNEKLLVHATQAQLLDIAGDGSVRAIEEISPPPQVHNTTSQAISNVDDIQAAPFNLDGSGVIMGIWDGGEVLTTHLDLTPRVTLAENSSPNDHSTHVAGTMIGSGANQANAEGMAPNGGQLFSYNFNGSPVTEQENAVDNRNIVLSNHSWGAVVGWEFQGNPGVWVQTGNTGLNGAYNGTTADWDDLVVDKGLIVMKSSGNDGNDCNPNPPFDCDGVTGGDGRRYNNIAQRGNAKNIITVGAVNDNTTIANFSSAGPADDGRIKPDVVANGVGLNSTWAGGVTLNSCGANSGVQYCSIGGTSMSTPTVSGIVADLVQRYRDEIGGDPSPDIIKALLVNSSQDLGRPGPDYTFGHGLVDALAAVNIIDVGQVRILTGAVDQGDVDEYIVAVPGGTPNLRVTLNWIDPEGQANSGNPDIVNNLDVEVIAPDGTTFFPWIGPGTGAANVANNATRTGPNSIDTVEDLLVDNPDQGFWTVRVKGTGVPEGPQNYALVANASFSLDDQPDIRVNAPLDFDETCADDFQDSVISIFNTGGADLQVNSVSVVAGGTNFSVLENPTQPFLVAPGAHVDVTVRFAPDSPGVKLGTLEIASNDPDEGVINLEMTGEGGVGDVNATMEADGEFGDVALGGFGLLTLQVLNQGTCNLTLVDLQQTAGGADFTVGGVPGAGLPKFPLVLSTDAHVFLPFRFRPSAFGPQTATFQLETDDPDTPFIDVELVANSPPSDVRVTGSSDFGEVCVGILAEQEIDICNVGLSDLVVGSVSFNPACDDFTLINNPFPANVSHDFCLPLTIRYTPMDAGVHTCTLEIVTNDPGTPVINLSVTGSTPPASIDVPPDLGFLPEVLQSVGVCETPAPFPISNTGTCPLTITDVSLGGSSPGDYALSGLPSFPILLDPGHIAGDGDLDVVFAPTVLDRSREADLMVTYLSDPVTGTEMTATRSLCGEGVYTGARVLVTDNGVPFDTVERIQIQRITANRNRDRLDTVDTSRNLPLISVTPQAPCPDFEYHKEYGTVSNPIQLLPGSYNVNVSVKINGKNRKKSVGFDVSTCDFNPTVVVDF